MNSLNILSARVISGRSASGPSRPRSRSQESLDICHKDPNARASSAPGSRSYSLGSLIPRSNDENDPPSPSPSSTSTAAATTVDNDNTKDNGDDVGVKGHSNSSPSSASSVDCCSYDEPSHSSRERDMKSTTDASALYPDQQIAASISSPKFFHALCNHIHSFAQALFNAIAGAITALLSLLTAPAFYLLRAFYEEHHGYSPLAPFRKLRRKPAFSSPALANRDVKHSPSQKPPLLKTPFLNKKSSRSMKLPDDGTSLDKPRSRGSFSSCASDSDVPPSPTCSIDTSRPSSSSSSSSRKTSGLDLDRLSPSTAQPRRSIRIELNDEGTRRRQRQRRQHEEDAGDSRNNSDIVDLSTADMLKSPMSSSRHKITKYPHSYPVPPRPLIPYRQPSYGVHDTAVPKKTLILDLDETLIHSLAKGGRMSSGHMVEVRLTNPVAAAPTVPHGAPMTLGPQHPILYYVHKRPHCDDFLRKVCKWYKLVVFTASVQEYADPVIDWLEQERKYFHSRYYRQHCTFRQGAYIKDLSSVEPDLSKVMILDNSPMSYIFHEGELDFASNIHVILSNQLLPR